ncbi:MAG: low molecular weight phosphotyrosine protein phosphatase, partial [Flavobacteriales bacterium]|nr:low molecular weight phosphotyrosine protein phosphatase [Flavobacteriales bacterium]
MKKILMVCLGNICRSPVADGLLRKKVESSGLDVLVDSCGTGGWHVGEAPDPRSQENALKNGLDISMLRARQIQVSDLEEYDHIYCMDKSNLHDVLALATSEEQRMKVSLMLNNSHPDQNKDVPDPYFGGSDGFQKVFDLLDQACDSIIQ